MKTIMPVMCAVCAAITCVLAPIAVPSVGSVPISMATFAVLLSGMILGGKFGAVSQGIYLLIGAAGVPVFAGYAAGWGQLLGPTGGYLIGYIPMAFVAGAVYYRFGRQRKGIAKIIRIVCAAVLGEIALYIFGTAWFCFVTGSGVIAALAICVLPFLIGDAAKIAVIAILVPQLERAIGKIGGQKPVQQKTE